MTGFPWWAWVVLAGGLGLTEMGVPGAYLMWIAFGAALTALADATIGLSLEGQLGTFAVASALSCVAGFFVYRRMQPQHGAEAPLNEPHRAMLGARGTVYEAFLAGRGKVRIGDTVWLATGPDLAEGASIVVSGVQGTRLVVAGIEPKPSTDAATPTASQ